MRTASRPAAGALRVGIDVSLANIAVYFASMVVPDAIMGDVENLLVIGVASGLAFVGKYLRNEGNALGQVL